MASTGETLKKLKVKTGSDRLKGMDRYGMIGKLRLRVSVPDIRIIVKDLGKGHKLVLELWKTGILEARIVAEMIREPEKLIEV